MRLVPAAAAGGRPGTAALAADRQSCRRASAAEDCAACLGPLAEPLAGRRCALQASPRLIRRRRRWHRRVQARSGRPGGSGQRR